MREILETEGYADWLASIPNSYSLIVNNQCKMCGGLLDHGDGRALAWMLVSNRATASDLIFTTQYARKIIPDFGFRRIEAIVREGFANGFRWARLLGFRLETENGMSGWFKDGQKGYLFARSFA